MEPCDMVRSHFVFLLPLPVAAVIQNVVMIFTGEKSVTCDSYFGQPQAPQHNKFHCLSGAISSWNDIWAHGIWLAHVLCLLGCHCLLLLPLPFLSSLWSTLLSLWCWHLNCKFHWAETCLILLSKIPNTGLGAWLLVFLTMIIAAKIQHMNCNHQGHVWPQMVWP